MVNLRDTLNIPRQIQQPGGERGPTADQILSLLRTPEGAVALRSAEGRQLVRSVLFSWIGDVPPWAYRLGAKSLSQVQLRYTEAERDRYAALRGHTTLCPENTGEPLSQCETVRRLARLGAEFIYTLTSP
jgi:hypothetical protein